MLAMFLLGGGIAAFVGAIRWARRDRARRMAAAATTALVVDEWGVKRWLADGRYEEVGWDEVKTVEAYVLPKGPWGERLRFVLDGGGLRGVVVPGDVAREEGLVVGLGRLPGFDFRHLAEVIDSTQPGKEVLWTRPDARPAAAGESGT
jgi:hypothetical protein